MKFISSFFHFAGDLKLPVLLVILLVLGGAASPQTAQTAPPNANEITIPLCYVTLEEKVEVASQEEGILKALPVEKGMTVSAGQLLAQIDDEIPKMRRDVAKNKLAVAEVEANNKVKLRYALASQAVAGAELQKDREANQRMPGAVTDTQKSQDELKYKEAMLSAENALKELEIARLQYNVSKAELNAAEEDVKRRKIYSPTKGVIDMIYKHVGEWVQKGDPVLHLVQVDPLHAHGNVEIARYAPGDLAGRKVTVTVTLTGGLRASFPGKVSFIDPQVSGGKYVVWAKIENRQENGHWLLHAGMDGEMTIHLK